LDQVPGLDDGGFAAHALLAAVRADLVEHLAGRERVPRERMRARLAGLAARILGADAAASAGGDPSGAAADHST
jgi:hypothetical protein